MATLLARGQITIAAIRDGTDGKDYWQQDVRVDLSAATYDQNTWYTVVGERLPVDGFAGIKVVVNLNSGTKPSWSTHSAGFSVDFHIDTQASGWGTTHAETIIYSDTFSFCSVSPVSYKQLGYGSIPILYLRGGGRYRVISTYNAAWKIYKDGYTWQSGKYSQSAMPSNTRPTPEGHTLKGDKGDKGMDGEQGEQGYGIVAAVIKNNYTESDWSVYAAIDRVESYSNTSSIRNGCRIGDIFTVSGKATDTGNYHIAYYRCTNSSGDLQGKCFAHTISPKGDKGDTGNAGLTFANGKSLYKDLLFDKGYNGCVVYNNLENKNIKLTIVPKSSDNPYAIAKKELKIETTGAAYPGHGGVQQEIKSRASAVFVRRVIAKIPKGYTLHNAENAMGTGMVNKWLTPNVGTGTFTEYIYMYQCGASGNFSTAGHMYLSGGTTATADKPVVWYIASCETYDMTAGSSAQIKSTEVMYATSTSGTSAPTSGWQKNIPTVASGSFLWSMFTITYMDGSKAVLYNVSKMGDRGPAGKDAVSASFSPAALTFSAKTDSNGNATADTTSGNTATITMLEGSSKVTGTYSITSTVGCTATISGSTVTVKSVAHDTIDGRAISRTSANVTVKCVYNGKTCYVDLPISVSVSAVWGGLVTSQKGLESKYTEISNKYNALPLKTQDELTQYTSSIKQSARNISLKVGETVVGRHNLLTGSAFERKTDFWQGNDSYMPYISVLNNYKGYNSAVIEGKSGTNRGVDFILVKVNAARKNVVSAMLKCSGTVSDREFYAYILQRDGSMADLNKNLSIPLSAAKNMIANEWMLAAETLTLDANTAYIDCVFLYYGTKTAYIACPQIAEGEEYAGYTLSEQDRGYIGGNLLINTDTLVKPDTLSIYNSDPLVVDSTHTSLVQEGNANKYGSYATLYTDATSAEVNTIRWNLKGMNLIKQGQMYMLSFVAKGTGKVCAFLYNDGTPLVSTEASGFTSSNQSADGNALITLTSSWQRYFVFWRVVGDKLPIYVLFRAMKGSKLYLSQPKMEYGATATEWRAKKTGYVEDKSIAGSLLDAGIDINSKEIMLTADKTTFRTTKGTKVAMFDEDGLNAQLVRAQRLQTKGKNGIEVRIEDGMVQIFGAAGVANIRFGLDDNGYATLGYYDNNGNLLYDLGPKGIAKLDVSDSTMTRTAFIDIDAAGLVSPYTEKKNGYLWITDENNNKFFGLQGKPNTYVRVNLGVSKSVTLYKYRAPRLNGEVIADDKYSMTKSQTEKADGCYFTSSQIQIVGSNFTNLAKGTYLPWDAKTQDNTKYRPIGVKSVPKLSVNSFMSLSTSALASTSQLQTLSTVYGGGIFVFPDDGFGNVEIS
nr:MAG TPA: tail protein [Caudoviricetes sp.]DAI00168.1 MAG TPA: tail protein [Caudoviricetes sp.]